jgi:hypothetical protein
MFLQYVLLKTLLSKSHQLTMWWLFRSWNVCRKGSSWGYVSSTKNHKNQHCDDMCRLSFYLDYLDVSCDLYNLLRLKIEVWSALWQVQCMLELQSRTASQCTYTHSYIQVPLCNEQALTIHKRLSTTDKYPPLDCTDSNIQCPLIRSNMLDSLSTHRDTI